MRNDLIFSGSSDGSWNEWIISTFQTYFIFSIQIEHSFEVSISTDNHKMEVNIHSVLPLYDNG